MKFFIVLSALVAVALAKPHAVVPLAYAHVLPGAPIGADGRVVDTPEVSHAKAEHAAAHINEKVTLAQEAVKSADVVAYAAPAVVSAYAAPAVVSAYSAPAVVSAYAAPHLVRVAHGAAPTGIDGRVVDTPEVSYAKAEHAAAHINEKVTLANEAVKNHAYSAVVPAAYSAVVPAAYSAYAAPAVVSAYSAPALAYGKVYSGVAPVVSAYSAYAPALRYGAPLSLDGRVVDTPEVAHAKAAHFAAHAEAKARLGYAGHYGYAAPAVSVW